MLPNFNTLGRALVECLRHYLSSQLAKEGAQLSHPRRQPEERSPMVVLYTQARAGFAGYMLELSSVSLSNRSQHYRIKGFVSKNLQVGLVTSAPFNLLGLSTALETKDFSVLITLGGEIDCSKLAKSGKGALGRVAFCAEVELK